MKKEELIISLLKQIPGDPEIYIRHPEAEIPCEIVGLDWDPHDQKYVIVTK